MKMTVTRKSLLLCAIGLMFHTLTIAHTQVAPNPIDVPVGPVVTSDVPKPGTTSVTLYKADYLKLDGTPNPNLAFTFMTSAHSDVGVKMLSSSGAYIGAATITGLPVGTRDASIRSYFYVGYWPTGDLTVKQTATDANGAVSNRSFVIHVLAVNPAKLSTLTPSQKTILKIK